MFYWIYDYPEGAVLAAMAGLFVVFTVVGVNVVGPLLRRLLGSNDGGVDYHNAVVSCFCAFYGLLVGLIAVAAYQNHDDAENTVNREASGLAGLYRCTTMYPEPLRGELHGYLQQYLDFVIEKAWPQQQQGILPQTDMRLLDALSERLGDFEPVTSGEQAMHAECLRALSEFLECRRCRLFHVGTGIPESMWYVVWIGAVLNLCMLWAYTAQPRALLGATGLLAGYIGVVIGLIVVMDHPFRGKYSVTPEPFLLLREFRKHCPALPGRRQMLPKRETWNIDPAGPQPLPAVAAPPQARTLPGSDSFHRSAARPGAPAAASEPPRR